MTRYTILSTATVRDALGCLNELSGGRMTLFVTDSAGLMLGTLTDGDIRRALLGGVSLGDPVTRAMHTDFRSLRADDIDVARFAQFRREGKMLVPVLDAGGKITDVIDLGLTRSRLPVSAILMAGGLGERLRPMTLTVPKPLLEIEGKAIIDYNVEALAAVGVTDITVCCRYLAEKIYEHFSAPVAGVNVKCVTETMPLGTIGAVSLVDIPAAGDTIVMNSDLLTTISFEEMYLRHRQEDAAVTIAAIPYVVSVPYAILGTEGCRVTSLEEKPVYSYYANAGIYMISNRLLRSIRPDMRLDATTFVEQALAAGERVIYYPVSGTWIDVGSPADFRHAEELMRHHRSFK